MEKYIEQILLYFQEAPIWPFLLFGLVGVVAVGVEFVNRRRRADAVAYYDSIFREELVGLYPVATRWPDDLVAHMQQRLPILRDAFETLRNFIPQDQLRKYNVAWNKFYEFSRTGGLEQENTSEDSVQEPEAVQARQQQQQQTFQQLVADLLIYTEQFKK